MGLCAQHRSSVTFGSLLVETSATLMLSGLTKSIPNSVATVRLRRRLCLLRRCLTSANRRSVRLFSVQLWQKGTEIVETQIMTVCVHMASPEQIRFFHRLVLGSGLCLHLVFVCLKLLSQSECIVDDYLEDRDKSADSQAACHKCWFSPVDRRQHCEVDQSCRPVTSWAEACLTLSESSKDDCKYVMLSPLLLVSVEATSPGEKGD